MPDIPGAEHARVYRTIDDVDWLVAEVARLPSAARPPAARARRRRRTARSRGRRRARTSSALSPPSCTRVGWLMSAQLDEGAGRALGRIIGGQGITLHLGTRPRAIRRRRAARCSGVTFTNGAARRRRHRRLRHRHQPPRRARPQPGSSSAAAAAWRSAPTAARPHPRVWAIGEVAYFEGRCTGLVAPANAMAEVVADRLLGGAAEFTTVDDATKLKLSGVDVASFGDALARTEQRARDRLRRPRPRAVPEARR